MNFTPTNTGSMPGKNDLALEQLLGYEGFSKTKQNSPTSN